MKLSKAQVRKNRIEVIQCCFVTVPLIAFILTVFFALGYPNGTADHLLIMLFSMLSF